MLPQINSQTTRAMFSVYGLEGVDITYMPHMKM